MQVVCTGHAGGLCTDCMIGAAGCWVLVGRDGRGAAWKAVRVTRVVLLSGSDQRVAAVADALRAAGAEVVAVDDPQRLAEVLSELPAGQLQGYVQLPVRLVLEGSSVVERVRGFLEGGLLSRFDAVRAVLPALADDARVVLVAGNTSGEGKELPDDRSARLALLEVLAHAIRADTAAARVRVQVLDHRSPAEIAEAVLRAASPVPKDVADLRRREVDMSYDDWRTEVLGMATVEV